MTQILAIIILLGTLVGCQVASKSGDEGLVAGHVPVTNTFSVTLPSNRDYKLGDVLTFTLTHPYDVTVTGNPRLSLTIGATTYYANYTGGDGTRYLTFQYTVLAGHNDNDGITIATAIDLNGGSLTFNTATAASLTISPGNTSSIKVDTTAPSITDVIEPIVTHYYTGQTMIFRVVFSETVIVTGVPSINFTLDTCTPVASVLKSANYVTGSGTNTLTFAYTMENTCNDTNNSIPVDANLVLNSGTVKDAAGNSSSLVLVGLNTPLTSQARGRYPLISSVTAPANGTYTPGQTLDFTFNFDRVVTASASTAYVLMTLGAVTTKQVTYVSGSGSTALVFRYTVIGGDVDSDGVQLGTTMVNEGTICSGAFCLVNNVTDVFASPVSTGVIVHAPIPTITSIELPTSSFPASGYYKLGTSMQVIVHFSEIVTVTGGTPLLQATVGTTARNFSYLSGSGTPNLIFQYTVVNTDLDTDGVDLVTPLNLNGALIQNANGTNANLTFTFTINPLFRFDGVPPTITATALVANTPSAVDYKLGDIITLAVTFSETVTVSGSSMALTINGVTRNANYTATGSTGTIKRFVYTVGASDSNAGQAAVLTIPTTVTGGTIQDVALNDIAVRTSPAVSTAGIDVDGTIPVLTSFTLPANGLYKNGDILSFTANYSEPVTVVGTPTWVITLNSGGPAIASYVSGSGTNNLVFTYTVDGDDSDNNGTGISTANSFTFGGGSSIGDSSVNNAASATLPARNTTLINVDGIAPTVSSIAQGSTGTFDTGEFVDISVTYSEAVIATGSPQLQLTVGATTKYATYVSGSTTTTLLYRYIVEAGAQDHDGVRVDAHNLNGGSITDIALNPANLATTPQTFPTLMVDALAPTLTSITPPSNGLRISGQTLPFTVTYDEPVNVIGAPSLSLDIGGSIVAASYASGSGTTSIVFTTPPMSAAEFDLDGIAYSSGTISLNGGSIRDSKLHPAGLTFTTAAMPGIQVIYSSVVTWIDMGTTSGGTIASVASSSPGGLTATAVGSITRNASDVDFNNRTSASMTNPGSVYFSMAAISNTSTIFVVFKKNASPVLNDLVGDGTKGIILVDSTSLAFGSSARYAINGGGFSLPAASCLGCYNAATKILTVKFDIAQSLGAIRIGDFSGKIAEVWILNNTLALTDAQVLKIQAYLNSRY